MTVKRIDTVLGPRYYNVGTSTWANSRADVRKKLRQRIAKPIAIPMDTTGFAIPKPSARTRSQPKDGRLIESPRQYTLTKWQLWITQNHKCVRVKDGKECGTFMPTPAYGHRHHLDGRGLGGGKRNDRRTVLFCISCHNEEHGQ